MMTTANMSEKQLLTDLMNQEKHLVTTYATFVTEASCNNLRRLLTLNMIECGQDQFSVFEQMTQRSMYSTKSADNQEMQQASQDAQKLKQESGM